MGDCFQFVTRAVRVIDLITNIDMLAFQAHEGLNSFINRLSVSANSMFKNFNTSYRLYVTIIQSSLFVLIQLKLYIISG